MSTNTTTGSLDRSPFQAQNQGSLAALGDALASLAQIYRQFGLTEGDARRAAKADFESDFVGLALAA